MSQDRTVESGEILSSFSDFAVFYATELNPEQKCGVLVATGAYDGTFYWEEDHAVAVDVKVE